MGESPAIAYLSLGSNLGNRLRNLVRSLEGIVRYGTIEAVSSLYETDPIPPKPPQPNFYNAVCRIRTILECRELLLSLKSIEAECGRLPMGPRNGPRPLDIDILLYNTNTLDDPDLTLPHPKLANRGFVLFPLVEIAPDLRHPRLGSRMATLLSATERPGIRRIADPSWPSSLEGRQLL